ncbi:unnamed protein product [Polarella glacialis]|uniref:Uncharacterized protein n=1 Tax=Polarella glacialis TaxID=89957 RepID=A0A813GHK2_POLGL|nr:unnamed protein product [Polarella glacialis]
MASSEGQVMQLTFSQKWHKSIEALLWGASEPKVLFLWSAYRPVLVAGFSLAAISGVDAFSIAVLALLFLAALHGFLRYAQEPSQPPPGGPSHFEPLLESWRSLSSGRCKAAPTVAAERTPACSAHEQNSLQFEDVGVAQPMAQVARAWLHMARASRRPVHPPMKQGDTKHLGSSSDIGGSLTESDSAACTPWDLTDSDVGGIPQRTAAARRIEIVLERRLDEPWGFVWSTGTARARHRLVLDGVLTNSAAGCWNARQRELGLRALERGDLLVDANGARGSQPIQRELSAADFIKAGFLRPFAALPPSRPCLQASPVYECRVKNSFIEVSCAGGAESHDDRHDDRHAMSDPGPFVTWPASLAFGPGAERNKVAGNVKQQILPTGGVSGTGSSKGFSEDDVSACYLTEAETVSDLIGARAVISGLVRSPEFNGHSCLIEAYDVEVKRYIVRVYLGDEGGPVTAKLRLENLSISPPAFSPVSMMPYILPHMQGHAPNFWQPQQASPSFFEWLQATNGFTNNFQFMPGQVGAPCTEVVPLEPATSSACLEVLAQVSQPAGLGPGLGGEMGPFAGGVQASALSPGPPEPGLRNRTPLAVFTGMQAVATGRSPNLLACGVGSALTMVVLPVKHSDLAASAELQVPCGSVPSDELQCLEPGASEEELAQEEAGEEGAGVQPGRRKRRRGKRKRGRGHQGEEELELAEDKALHVLETEELLEDVNKGLVDSERAEEAKETELHAAETTVQEDVQHCTTCGLGYVSDKVITESFKTLVQTSQLVDPLSADEEQAHQICSGAHDEEKENEGRLSDPEKCEGLTEIRWQGELEDPPEQKQLLIPHEQDDHQAVEEERDDSGAQELLPDKGASHELALEDEQGSSLPHETKTSSEDYLAASEVRPQAPEFAGSCDETAPDDAEVTSSSSCLPASLPWRPSLQRNARGGQADSQQASGSAESAELLPKSISGAVWRPTLRRL